MQQREHIAQDFPQAVLQNPGQDPEALAQAIEIIHARQYRQGERNLARYSARIMPLMPDADYLGDRGVDLIALANALNRGLDVALFGQVVIYKAWCIDEFNRFIRAGIGCDMINSGMQRFLDHPRNW